jgi:hypothetical protein
VTGPRQLRAARAGLKRDIIIRHLPDLRFRVTGRRMFIRGSLLGIIQEQYGVGHQFGDISLHSALLVTACAVSAAHKYPASRREIVPASFCLTVKCHDRVRFNMFLFLTALVLPLLVHENPQARDGSTFVFTVIDNRLAGEAPDYFRGMKSRLICIPPFLRTHRAKHTASIHVLVSVGHLVQS